MRTILLLLISTATFGQATQVFPIMGTKTLNPATGVYDTTINYQYKLIPGTGITIVQSAGSATISASGGSGVTSITAGAGLSGGTITTSGTISSKTHMQSWKAYADDTTTAFTATVPAGDTICIVTIETTYDPTRSGPKLLYAQSCSISGSTLTVNVFEWDFNASPPTVEAPQTVDFPNFIINATSGTHY